MTVRRYKTTKWIMSENFVISECLLSSKLTRNLETYNGVVGKPRDLFIRKLE